MTKPDYRYHEWYSAYPTITELEGKSIEQGIAKAVADCPILAELTYPTVEWYGSRFITSVALDFRTHGRITDNMLRGVQNFFDAQLMMANNRSRARVTRSFDISWNVESFEAKVLIKLDKTQHLGQYGHKIKRMLMKDKDGRCLRVTQFRPVQYIDMKQWKSPENGDTYSFEGKLENNSEINMGFVKDVKNVRLLSSGHVL